MAHDQKRKQNQLVTGDHQKTFKDTIKMKFPDLQKKPTEQYPR